MIAPNPPFREIDGNGRTIRGLLAGRKYRAFDGSSRRAGFPSASTWKSNRMDLDAHRELYPWFPERIWDAEQLTQGASS